jgi:hypothetical protein
MRKIFLAITLLATGFICVTADVQPSGVAGKTSVSAATPDSTLLAHILRRRRVG